MKKLISPGISLVIIGALVTVVGSTHPAAGERESRIAGADQDLLKAPPAPRALTKLKRAALMDQNPQDLQSTVMVSPQKPKNGATHMSALSVDLYVASYPSAETTGFVAGDEGMHTHIHTQVMAGRQYLFTCAIQLVFGATKWQANLYPESGGPVGWLQGTEPNQAYYLWTATFSGKVMFKLRLGEPGGMYVYSCDITST